MDEDSRIAIELTLLAFKIKKEVCDVFNFFFIKEI
jgi:hypothetical protein